jgi:teichuronic acid biosynthesis protein TuaE
MKINLQFIKPQFIIVPFISLLGIVLAFGIAKEPIVGIGFILLSIAAILSLFFPETVAWLALFSISISPQYIIGAEGLMGIETASIHKLIILVALIPFTLRYGFRQIVNAPILAFIVVLFLTFTVSDRHPNLSMLQPFKSFLGLTLGWYIFNLKWKPKNINKYIFSLSIMAVINLGFGVILKIAGVRPFYHYDFTGAFRLSGSSIAAHLAMLAYIGIQVSINEVPRGKKNYLWLSLFNFAILVATGTRGATIGAIMLYIPYGYDQLKKILRGRTTPYFVLLLVAGVVIALYGIPAVVTRTFGYIDISGQLNTSGRLSAWEFFFTEAMENPLFGRGLGAGTVANTGQVYAAFRVPHNEYIRLLIDGGIVGAVIVIFSFILVFRKIFRYIEPNTRHYLLFLYIGFAIYSFFDNTLSTTQFLLPFCWHLALIHTRSIITRIESITNPGLEPIHESP